MTRSVVLSFCAFDHEINLGLASIAAALEREGIRAYLELYRDIPGQAVDTPGQVASRIMARAPTVVGFSVLAPEWSRIREVIRALRERWSGMIVVGGTHAILCPDDVLAEPAVDAVCLGEGEQPMIDLVGSYAEHGRAGAAARGMRFRSSGGSAPSQVGPWWMDNLDDYPYLDYGLFESASPAGLRGLRLGLMASSGLFSLPLIVGRGCPYSCSYCCNAGVADRFGGMKSYVRGYPPESAVSHIQRVVERFRPDLLEFFDEVFVRDKQAVRQFSRLYRERVNLPFVIFGRAEALDAGVVGALAEAGLKLVFIGVESGDEQYRTRYLGRRGSNEGILRAVRLLREHGILVITFNMFAMPFETRDGVESTFRLNEAIAPDAAYSFRYQPLPGSELARMAAAHGLIREPPKRWDYQSETSVTPGLPPAWITERIDAFNAAFASQERLARLYAALRRACGKQTAPERPLA